MARLNHNDDQQVQLKPTLKTKPTQQPIILAIAAASLFLKPFHSQVEQSHSIDHLREMYKWGSENR